MSKEYRVGALSDILSNNNNKNDKKTKKNSLISSSSSPTPILPPSSLASLFSDEAKHKFAGTIKPEDYLNKLKKERKGIIASLL